MENYFGFLWSGINWEINFGITMFGMFLAFLLGLYCKRYRLKS